MWIISFITLLIETFVHRMPQKRNRLTFPLFNSPIPYSHAVVCCLTSPKLSSMYTKVRGTACTVQEEIILISTQVLIRMTFPTY